MALSYWKWDKVSRGVNFHKGTKLGRRGGGRCCDDERPPSGGGGGALKPTYSSSQTGHKAVPLSSCTEEQIPTLLIRER